MFRLTISERRRRVFRYCRDALHAVAFRHNAQADASKSFSKISREQHTPFLKSQGPPEKKFETIQWADHGVREVWKLRSVRISPETGKPSGYLWHYGHFIHDLIMPLADWLVEGNIDPEAIDLYIEHTPEQSVGPYVDLIKSLLGVRAELLAVQSFKDLDGKDLVLHAYLFGPYKRSSLDNVQQLVLSRFDLRPAAAISPEVILIERGHYPNGFENNREIPESSKKNGKQRRMIVNHDELSAALDARYGRRFCGVVLEEIPVSEQIRLFHHARVVIAQHGGGLNNIIWMKGNDGVVVELAPTAIRTFQNLCLAKGLTYRTLGPMNKRMPRIDSAELLRLLDSLGC